MSVKSNLRYAAILAFLFALILTGVGGWSNMLGRAFVITAQPEVERSAPHPVKGLVVTEQHAWNDGLFLMMVAIFLLLFSTV